MTCKILLLVVLATWLSGSVDAAGEGEHAPGRFVWADFDGDGLEDVYAVRAGGGDSLFRNVGDGSFEDVTARALPCVSCASLEVAWRDVDLDGRPDLLRILVSGGVELLRNRGDGVFEDVTLAAGLEGITGASAARWLDYDADGRADVEFSTQGAPRLFHNLGDFLFEAVAFVELCRAAAPEQTAPVRAIPGALDEAAGATSETGRTPRDDFASGSGRMKGGAGALAGSLVADVHPDPLVVGAPAVDPLEPTPNEGLASSFANGCALSVKDRVTGNCVFVSTLPSLGKLYPISANLFVATSGDVGIGTTNPVAKLDVAGTTRMTDTLTLDPSGDQALDVSAGSIYKEGVLFLHTRGGMGNSSLGKEALTSVTNGGGNTAFGFQALRSNTTGYKNTANGDHALSSNTIGKFNTATGHSALSSNTTGLWNTATGYSALASNTIGFWNTASGNNALRRNTTGSSNTACGSFALFLNTTGRDNTATGDVALQLNTTGIRNTATGRMALRANTKGSLNTASGYRALVSNKTGNSNTATGVSALIANTTGSYNAAVGVGALFDNLTGSENSAMGHQALYANTTGSENTAIGRSALSGSTTGDRNIAVGRFAGSALTTGSDNIAIGNPGISGDGATIRVGSAGTHTRAFLAGIHGVTTDVADGIPVVVDSAGQLGTVSSSRRFKEDVADMGEATERLLDLRPVTFRYKAEVQQGERPVEYGLIAEEVAEIFPDIVVYDEEGLPFTVKYHLLASMLLNELKKNGARDRERQRELERELAELREELTDLKAFSPRALPASVPVSNL